MTKVSANAITVEEILTVMAAVSQEPWMKTKYIIRPCVLCFKRNGPRDALIRKGPNSLQRLHACSSFISQDEMMSESTVETLENALGLHFISKMGLTCL